MKKIQSIIAAACLLGQSGLFSLQAQTPGEDPVLKSIRNEIDRNMKGLRTEDTAPPFYIDFRVNDVSTLNIRANRGQLVYSKENTSRNGSPMLLVGNYENSNSPNPGYGVEIALGENDPVIRTAIWGMLDARYKSAIQEYGNKQARLKQIKIAEEEKDIPDFQTIQPTQVVLPAQPFSYDKEKLEEYVRKASAVFSAYKELDDSNVGLYATNSYVRYYNSEGTQCCYPSTTVNLSIYTYAQNADGQEIYQEKTLPFCSIDELPEISALQTICKEQAELIKRQLAAPMIKDPYVGPVLFEGEAVADLVEKYMVNNRTGILAQRKFNELEPLLNKKVISRDLSLSSLSGTPSYKGQKLFGYFEVDAQGVTPAPETVLIEDGVLKNMLTTRIPTRLFRESNGHSRLGGAMPAPGVLRLSSRTVTPVEEIKQKLIAAAKEEDYECAYIVRRIANTFSGGDCIPAEIYRINLADGTEELVRGTVLKNLELRTFKKFLGISDQENIYNRSRSFMKVSFIVPSAILFEDIDVVKDPGIVLKNNYTLQKPE